MSQFKIEEGPLTGLKLIKPINVLSNEKEFQTYNKLELSKQGFNIDFVQENQSVSHYGVLRGMHFQKNHPQGKLIRVANGKIYDVVVDMRKESNTYKQWYGIELSSANMIQFYIPEGFAHGFLALENETIVIFKVTDFFHPCDEIGFKWNDPEIQINWPIMKNLNNDAEYITTHGNPVILNWKDRSLPLISEIDNLRGCE